MAEDNDDSSKTHEPTQKKLEDARRKGDIPRSTDITTAAAYAGFLVSLLAFTVEPLQELGAVMASLIGEADRYSEVWFGGSAKPLSADLIIATMRSTSIWFLLPAATVILAILGQRAFVFAPEKINPKIDRLSIFKNFANKFGISGLFEFFKSFAKLIIYSFVLGAFLYINLEDILSLVEFSYQSTLRLLAQLTIEFFSIVLVIAAVLGAIDYSFQYFNHIRKNRMSRYELTEETKRSEGDPHMKQERRQRAYDLATNRMMESVPDADVIIVNPTHYAVALKWTRAPGTAPECVAKGVDLVAARIREIAQENAVPIQRDPLTARAIYATVEIGEEVRPDHYQAVAAAIRFAEEMRKKVRAQ
jgi:flagellar biosynthetic protein FlhB